MSLLLLFNDLVPVSKDLVFDIQALIQSNRKPVLNTESLICSNRNSTFDIYYFLNPSPQPFFRILLLLPNQDDVDDLQSSGGVSVTADYTFDVEDLLFVYKNRSMSIEDLIASIKNTTQDVDYLIAAKQNRTINIEDLISASQSSSTNIDYEGLIQINKSADIEGLISSLQTKSTDIESLISTHEDKVADIEDLITVNKNPATNVDYAGITQSNNAANIESLLTANQNRAADIEDLTSAYKSPPLDIEGTIQIRPGRIIDIENLIGEVGEPTLDIDSLQNVNRSRTLDIDYLISFLNSPVINVEWKGTNLITADGQISIDWLITTAKNLVVDTDYKSTLQQSQTMDVESLIGLFKNAGSSVENLAVAARSPNFNIDYLAQILELGTLDIDFTKFLQLTKTLDIDNLQNLTLSRAFDIAYLIGVLSNPPINIENRGALLITQDGQLDIDWLGQQIKNGNTNIDYLLFLQDTKSYSIENIVAAQKLDRAFSVENLISPKNIPIFDLDYRGAITKDGSMDVAWSGILQAVKTINVDYLTNLAQSNNMSIEELVNPKLNGNIIPNWSGTYNFPKTLDIEWFGSTIISFDGVLSVDYLAGVNQNKNFTIQYLQAQNADRTFPIGWQDLNPAQIWVSQARGVIWYVDIFGNIWRIQRT